MKIEINGNTLSGTDLFKIVWRGYFALLSFILIPTSIIFVISVAIFKEPEKLYDVWFLPLLFPVIVAFQGVFFAGAVVLGNIIWVKFSKNSKAVSKNVNP